MINDYRLATLESLAWELGFGAYSELAHFVYRRAAINYRNFSIPKKTGGYREISAPVKSLKRIQRILNSILSAYYMPKKCAHGFISERSILSGAYAHVGKAIVLNADIKDFFPSISFYRVRGLLTSKPYELDYKVATVIAHICCFRKSLPQGAPTSPLLSNMICAKLDSDLMRLAKGARCSFSRYCDDLTFSFSCSKNRIPKGIAYFRDNVVVPGEELESIISSNGFSINERKVRVRFQSMRQEVTGVTVNRFPNIPRKKIRLVGSIIHAWNKYGREDAEKVHLGNFYKKHRPSGKNPALEDILRGRILYIGFIRGKSDAIFSKLAAAFNSLPGLVGRKISYIEKKDKQVLASESLWVIECYSGKDKEAIFFAQGTGFRLESGQLITCEHVVCDKNGSPYNEIIAYKWNKPTNQYSVAVLKSDRHRDIAICRILPPAAGSIDEEGIDLTAGSVSVGGDVFILGYPNHKAGKPHDHIQAKVTSVYPDRAIKKFNVDKVIVKGTSGGPVFDLNYSLVGIVGEGTGEGVGQNAVIQISELLAML